MNHISLFSGQGGFDLAAQWMGWNNIAHCEINPFCQRVLKYYWPHATTHTDIRTTDFSVYRGRCDILTGGFPCQPYSTAGKRFGKEDDRHLWPEMLRAIREISPRWVVGENVRGLTNWNGGMVFDEVQADLESAGYEVTPFILPAAGVGAPHRRDRIWIVANAIGQRFSKQKILCQQSRGAEIAGAGEIGVPGYRQELEVITYSNCSSAEYSIQTGRNVFTGSDWARFPTQSPLCVGDDGLSCRLDGIAMDDWQEASIAAAGNAIVPQVAYKLFKAIEQYELL